MGRLLENHSKQLLKGAGIPVPAFEVAASPAEAEAAARRLGGPVVLKALVPVGKRGKAGAVKFAATPGEAAQAAGELLKMTMRNFPVEKVLV
ncbi:MAG: acetate--CoA ligase family protein, partial [Moorella sp. (in: Bacteria)]|nr:acetate--CoA ligase family protein [Moorella sp. (in: firmicutes)]